MAEKTPMEELNRAEGWTRPKQDRTALIRKYQCSICLSNTVLKEGYEFGGRTLCKKCYQELKGHFGE